MAAADVRRRVVAARVEFWIGQRMALTYQLPVDATDTSARARARAANGITVAPTTPETFPRRTRVSVAAGVRAMAASSIDVGGSGGPGGASITTDVHGGGPAQPQPPCTPTASTPRDDTSPAGEGRR
ncbi:hypothetical protein ACFYPN_18300 [Streptomyces sp. NPDC005576]|uniref:hypothetical protein n=1 Tax=Streptomyces sp. NPDC005576 TaxID=3364726 RepID=UPI003681C1C2